MNTVSNTASNEEIRKDDIPKEDAGERRILYCHCAFARVVKEDVKEEVLAGLAASDLAFDAVPDLCELAARRDPSLRRLAAEGTTEIVACYPRAVRWLFHAAEADLPEDGVTIHNMRDTDPEAILARLLDPEANPEADEDAVADDETPTENDARKADAA